MCRYALKPYKSHWVCLNCRFTGKWAPALCDPRLERKRCHACGDGEMIDAGRDFRAPKKGDRNSWSVVIKLLASGARYDSCGCTGPGYRPATRAQLRRWEHA